MNCIMKMSFCYGKEMGEEWILLDVIAKKGIGIFYNRINRKSIASFVVKMCKLVTIPNWFFR